MSGATATGPAKAELLAAARRAIAAGDRAAGIEGLRAALAADPADLKLHAELAWELLQADRLDEAEAACTAALARASDEPGFLLRRGLIARRRGDRAAAIAQFRAVLRQQPDNAWARLELSLDLLHDGQLDEAEAICRALLAAGTSTAQARIRLGLAARRRGDHAAALDHFEAALAAEPGDGWARQERDRTRAALTADAPTPAPTRQELVAAGRAARQRGAHAEGAALLADALALDASDIGLHVELAWELILLGRLDAAEATCRAGLARAPDNADLLLRLGVVARRRGDRTAAIGHFRAALRHRPDHLWVRQELGAALLQDGQLDEAEAALRGVLAAQPGNVHALVRLGLVARRRGDRADALARFDDAARLAPTDPWPGTELATELREAGRTQEALALLDRVLAARPGHAEALRQRGLARMDAGDLPGARESFAAALAAGPDVIQARIELAQAERALGRTEEAERLLADAQERAPGSIGVLYALIGWRRQDSDMEAAVALCRRAVALQPGEAWLHALLAETLGAAGLGEEAEAVAAAALARFGAHPAVVQERVLQLRRRGDLHAARSLLRELPAEAIRGSFATWLLARELELQLGELALAEAAAADPPPRGTIRAKADHLLLRGQIASARWELDAAATCFAEAVAIDPDHGRAHHELARLALLRLDIQAARAELKAWMRAEAPRDGRRPGLWNLSQSMPGLLVHEFELDREMLAALRRIVAAPPVARIGPLRDAVAANPDQTSAAIMLLVSLRLAGLFDATAEQAPARDDGATERIPRRIVQFWTAPEPDPDLLPLLRSWEAMNPDHAYQRYDNRSATEYLRARHEPAVLAAFLRAAQPAQRADIFRLAYLGAEGGIWADADDRCLAPLSSVVPPGARFVAYQEDFGSVANNFLAVAPGHPAVLAALDQAVAAVQRGDQDMIWLSTGPGLLSRALAVELAREPLPIVTALRGMRLLTRAEM